MSLTDETSNEETHDATGTGISDLSTARGAHTARDFIGLAPGRSDTSEAVQEEQADTTSDPVNHPKHYTSHPSGVECITVTEHMNFNLGNAIKYIWRAGDKGNLKQDLEKARWYLDREIARIS